MNNTSGNIINEIENVSVLLSTYVQSIKCIKLTGEVISNKTTSGNSYITIKNGDWQINCIGWSRSFPEIKTGFNVEIIGSLNIFKKNLSVYYNIKNIKVVGSGDYLNSHADLRQKICNLGWNINKKYLNKFPMTIGILTSIEGAAVQDILQSLKLDKFIGQVLIFNVLVQGKQCSQSVIYGIEYFHKLNIDLDLLMITRGGGSYDDLVGFSDFNLLESIHKCKYITLSAVGHQIDNQLSDEVADYKFATPSLGAKFIVETQQKYLSLLEKVKNKLIGLGEKIIVCKNKINYVRDNYKNIINLYDRKELNAQISKYKNNLEKITNSWAKTKTDFYSKLSNLKPTIYKTQEVTSITDFIDGETKKELTPKKIEIIFADGKVNLYYKIIDYEFN
jgi:exodeoxyribonuclease VII large subunit